MIKIGLRYLEVCVCVCVCAGVGGGGFQHIPPHVCDNIYKLSHCIKVSTLQVTEEIIVIT